MKNDSIGYALAFITLLLLIELSFPGFMWRKIKYYSVRVGFWAAGEIMMLREWMKKRTRDEWILIVGLFFCALVFIFFVWYAFHFHKYFSW